MEPVLFLVFVHLLTAASAPITSKLQFEPRFQLRIRKRNGKQFL